MRSTGWTVAAVALIAALLAGNPAIAQQVTSQISIPSATAAEATTPIPAARQQPPMSVKAPLAKAAYRGLACDPFAKRLRKTALPNGRGPEARVAAACLRLEWLSRAKTSTPTITVHRSPTFPDRFVDRLEKATAAGHRLFGRFADVSSYEVLASLDANYSCREGKRIFDPRVVIRPWFGTWERGYNTGCPGTDYSPAGWTSAGLGEGADEFFAWTLIKPEHAQMLNSGEVLGPTWFFGAVSHEFAHNIQMQRSIGSTNGQELIGRWFGEGQAQYLGNTAAVYTIGPADIRSAQLQQLKDVMREEGVTRIDLASMAADWQTNLVYPAGYFAYEWLVAHYGLQATFDWWTTWNTDCERPGSDICWRERAQETFGMSADELIVQLNDYVNQQISEQTKPGKEGIVVETVPRSDVNTFFDTDVLYHPSLAQSLRVNRQQRWNSVTLSVFQVKVAVSPEVFSWLVDGGYDEEWFDSYRSGDTFATKTRMTVEVWRYDEAGPVPDEFDLTDGFTRVHRSVVNRVIRAGKDVTLPLRRGVTVTQGDYVIVVGVRFVDPLVFNLRFDGQENGTNTKGGYDHDYPVDCTYTPSRDRNPGGQAYRPIPEGEVDLKDLVRPFASRYEVVDTKVATSCDLDGIYDPNQQIWNPGDLRMVIRGRNE